MTTPHLADTVGLFDGFTYARGYTSPQPAANPAAGTASTITVPGDRNYRVLAVIATLTTSATVATRTPKVNILDQDSNVLMALPSVGTLAASSAATIQGWLGNTSSYTAGDGTLIIPIPRTFLRPNWKIQLTATNLQAGDAFTGVRWLWEEFPIGQVGYPEQLLTADAPKPL